MLSFFSFSFFFGDSFHSLIKRCPFMSCRLNTHTHSLVSIKIFIFFISSGHCKWVEPSTAGRSKVRCCWRLGPCKIQLRGIRPTPHSHTHTHSQSISHTLTHTGTRAKMPLFHPSPTIQPAVIPSPPTPTRLFLPLSHHTLFLSRWRGGGGCAAQELSRCSHPAASSLFLYLSWGFFSLAPFLWRCTL